MNVEGAVTRTPLWRMTDEQLRAYVTDSLVPWDKRKTAEAILAKRGLSADRLAQIKEYGGHR